MAERQRRFAFVPSFAEGSDRDEWGPVPVWSMESTANLVTSMAVDQSQADLLQTVHLPAIDIDLPCRLVESSTPGHFHLLIDHPVLEDSYWALLDAMVNAGLVEAGYVKASRARGYTALRYGVKKEQTTDEH